MSGSIESKKGIEVKVHVYDRRENAISSRVNFFVRRGADLGRNLRNYSVINADVVEPVLVAKLCVAYDQ